MKKSKITAVEILDPWSNNYGTFYPHKCTFENGDVAITNKVEADALKVGQELNYEITGQDKLGNNKFKEIQEEKRKPFGPRGSNASFALAYSKDWAIAQLMNGENVSTKDILKIADKFNEWLNEN